MKYIIEIKPEYEGTTKGIIVLGIKNNCLCVDELAVEELEVLNSDYINEHFGQLQDEAYKRGFEDGKEAIHKGCEGCKYEPIKGGTCVMCCNNYSNLWQKQDDGIKVGDVVEWGDELILITRLYTSGGFRWCDGFNKDGTVFHVLEENVSNGNQHFDIDKILGEMNE